MTTKAFQIIGLLFFVLYIITSTEVVQKFPDWVHHFCFFIFSSVAFLKTMHEKNVKSGV
jgi:hypothetical protein